MTGEFGVLTRLFLFENQSAHSISAFFRSFCICFNGWYSARLNRPLLDDPSVNRRTPSVCVVCSGQFRRIWAHLIELTRTGQLNAESIVFKPFDS